MALYQLLRQTRIVFLFVAIDVLLPLVPEHSADCEGLHRHNGLAPAKRVRHRIFAQWLRFWQACADLIWSQPMLNWVRTNCIHDEPNWNLLTHVEPQIPA